MDYNSARVGTLVYASLCALHAAWLLSLLGRPSSAAAVGAALGGLQVLQACCAVTTASSFCVRPTTAPPAEDTGAKEQLLQRLASAVRWPLLGASAVALWLLPLHLHLDWRYAALTALPGCASFSSYLAGRGALLVLCKVFLAIALSALGQGLRFPRLVLQSRHTATPAPPSSSTDAPSMPTEDAAPCTLITASVPSGAATMARSTTPAPPAPAAPAPPAPLCHDDHPVFSYQNAIIMNDSVDSYASNASGVSYDSLAVEALFGEEGPEDLCADGTEGAAAAECQSVQEHPGACILCAGVAGADGAASAVEGAAAVASSDALRSLYRKLDRVVARSPHLYKLDVTNGCYAVASGLRWHRGDPCPARTAVDFGKLVLKLAAAVRVPAAQQSLQMRVGIHAGAVMGAMLSQPGERYMVFGPVLDSADRLARVCQPGHIQVSTAVHEQLEHHHLCSSLGLACPPAASKAGQQHITWAGAWPAKCEPSGRLGFGEQAKLWRPPVVPPVLAFDKPHRKPVGPSWEDLALADAGVRPRYSQAYRIGWEDWQLCVDPASRGGAAPQCFALQPNEN